ncbi:MAG: ABC transporter permease [Thermoplasmata archaeon]
MVSLAKENLFHEKSKIAISVGGVVLSVFLIFTTTGLYAAMDTMMENMVLEAGADLWVTSKGASGSLHSPSLLPIELNESLEQIEGVERAAPLIRTAMTTNMNGKRVLLYIDGYDTESGMGGPWKVIEGASEPRSGEAIVDRVLAAKNGLSIGMNINIEGKEFKIVGISDETSLMIAYLVFLTYEDASSFLPENITNYFLIKVSSPSQLTAVKNEIENTFPEVSVATSEETANAYKEELLGGFLPILYTISGVGVFVGILIIGLLVYTLTIEKSKEYGILKAVGATNLYLYKIVLFQALIISMLGFLVGVIVSIPAIYLIQTSVPEFTVLVTSEMIVWAFLVFIVTGLVASTIPIRRLSRIDPAIVFKGG